jgi:hypothetical protein
MTSRDVDVCRHGLLTIERNGARIHAHDGSRCAPVAPAPAAAPPEPPEWVTEPVAPPTPAPVAEPPVASPPPLAYETVRAAEPPPADSEPPASARRSRPWLLVGGVVAAVLLLGAGVAGGLIARNEVDHEKDRTAAAERRATSLEDALAGKDATIAEQRDRIADYEQQQEQLRQREEQLDAREKALETPQGPNATTFGDGIYQARVAIQPGEYRTEGTDACYWAKLSTGDTNAIIENDFVAGPQTVTIDSPYFESENCGTWTKVTSE